jgi:hypothetical protein
MRRKTTMPQFEAFTKPWITSNDKTAVVGNQRRMTGGER